MIYANTVSGAFQTASYTDLFQVWFSDIVAPYPNWVENFAEHAHYAISSSSPISSLTIGPEPTMTTFSGLISASWMATCIYPPTGGIHFLPFTAQRIENAKAARELINELCSLQDNWDGYGASPISEQARKHASRFIDMIEAAPSGVPIPEISPTPSGTVAFEWESHDAQVYLEIGNTRYSGYTKLNKQPPAFIQGQADYLDQRIVASIQRAISAPATASPPVTEIHAQAPWHELVAA